jgi:hypothetical protein
MVPHGPEVEERGEVEVLPLHRRRLGKNIPDRLCQTYPWAPNCDPETVSIRRSKGGPSRSPIAHLDDIDLQRQWLLVA